MNVNSKKLLSFVVVLALVLSMAPAIAMPAAAADANPITTAIANGQNYVCKCGATVAPSDWVEISALTSSQYNMTGNANGATHYYLSADVSSSRAKATPIAVSGGTVCLHLNGHTITTTKFYAFIVDSNLNIIGNESSGITSSFSGTGGVLHINTAGVVVNLYGGTYTDSTNIRTLTTGSNGGTFRVHEGTTVNGPVILYGRSGARLAKLEVLGGEINGDITKNANSAQIQVLISNGTVNGALTFGTTGDIVVSATGGTFSQDPSAHVAAGYVATQNPDGSWTVAEAAAPTLPDHLGTTCHICGDQNVTWNAVTAAPGEITTGHYYLANNIRDNLKQTFLVNAGQKVCIDLNGKNIENTFADKNGVAFQVNGGELNIAGSGNVSVAGPGTAYGVVTPLNNGSVTIKGGNYTAPEGRPAAHVHSSGGTIEVLGGTFSTDPSAFVTEDGLISILTGKGWVVTEEATYAIADSNGYTAYQTAQAAVDAYTPGNGYILLGANAEIALTEGKEYYIDNCGNAITVTGSGKLLAMDSSNDDYEGNGSWIGGTVEGEVTNPYTKARYVNVTREGATTSYRLSLVMHKVVLRADPNDTGLYYKAKITCSEELKGLMENYGAIFDLVQKPDKNFKEQDTNIYTKLSAKELVLDEDNSVVTNTAFVYGILTKDLEAAAANAENGRAPIYANAYIEIDLNGDGEFEYVVAENVAEESLYSTMLKFDVENPDQRVKDLYDEWADYGISEWEFTYINAGAAE